MFRASIASIVLLAAAVATAPAAARVPAGPAGARFYKPPSHLPGKGHGGLIWARRLTGADVLRNASRNELLLYRSIGVGGKPVAVSGTVAVPKGRAPKGGWPVVTYAHGTTGAADPCAPSLDKAGDPVHAYNAYAYPLLQTWLKDGFAVVRTDYEGLGTPGVHPYLVGRSEGRSVLDAVRAARGFEPRLSRRVLIAGHSQGGHAALWAASLAPRWTPELRVRGTVAFAPASHIADQAKLLPQLKSPGGGLSAIAALAVRGIDTADPSLNEASLLSDAARRLYPQTTRTCYPELKAPGSFGGLAPASIYRSDADLGPTIKALGANDPEHLRIGTPVRIEQGTSDTTVFPAFTDQLVTEYNSHKIKVVYKRYQGVDHGGVVTGAPAHDATSWISSRLR